MCSSLIDSVLIDNVEGNIAPSRCGIIAFRLATVVSRVLRVVALAAVLGLLAGRVSCFQSNKRKGGNDNKKWLWKLVHPEMIKSRSDIIKNDNKYDLFKVKNDDIQK
jgi:hypothetical protein